MIILLTLGIDFDPLKYIMQSALTNLSVNISLLFDQSLPSCGFWLGKYNLDRNGIRVSGVATMDHLVLVYSGLIGAAKYSW